MRRFRMSVLSSAMAIAIFAGPVSAAPPDGGCPRGGWWELAPAPGPAADQNANGWSCRLEAPRGSGIYTYIDDVVR